jgi:hypothetical protein
MEQKDKQCVSFVIGTLVFWLMGQSALNAIEPLGAVPSGLSGAFRRPLVDQD